jgi:hypothetical protein
MKYVDVLGIFILVWLVAKFIGPFLTDRFGFPELMGFILSILLSLGFIIGLNFWSKKS